MNAKGRVFKYGANVDTDVIIPARYLNIADPKELATHAMEDIDAEFVKKMQPGDIVVATRNFGCGSSREHAPVAILGAGIPVVIAHSFARIFYRNSFNMGLLLLEVGDAVDKIHDGDQLDIDAAAGTIRNVTTGDSIAVLPLPSSMAEILNKGGLVPYVRERLQSQAAR